MGRRDARPHPRHDAAAACGRAGGRGERRTISARERFRHRHRPRGGWREAHPLRDVVVVGGGCYGTFYASQLAKAKARGKVDFRTVIVVDRNSDCRARRELAEAPARRFVTQDWPSFFDAYFLDTSNDHVVLSPNIPHLMFEWLLARARQRWPRRSITVDPVPGDIGTPYDRTAQDATRYVSFADWVCPTHCIEPALCPAIGAPRTWEMGDAVRALAERLRGAGESVAG